VHLLSQSRVRIASCDAAFERATQAWDWVASASRHVWSDPACVPANAVDLKFPSL
jgi:hypothetical protein